MQKTVTLNLKSEIGDEQIQLPEELWQRFEQKAKEMGIPPEELVVIALDNYVKATDMRWRKKRKRK